MTFTQKRRLRKKEEGKAKSQFRFFEGLSESSIHGFNHIFSSKSLLFRLVWTCLVLAAASACCYHLYSLILKYFKCEFYDNVIYSKDTKLIFPHVTICDAGGLSEYTVARGNHEVFFNVSKSWQKMKRYAQNKTDPILKKIFVYVEYISKYSG